MLLSVFVSWETPLDEKLPAEGPFLLLIGIIVFVTGTLMAWWQDR